MNIVPQNQLHSEHPSSKTSNFLSVFHISQILKACNAYKERGFSVKDVFRFAVENGFSNKSFYQKIKEGSVTFAKDTLYRFMNSLLKIKGIGYDVIAMVKKTENIHFRYKGVMQSAPSIFRASKKRRGSPKYLLAIEAEAISDNKAIPVKLVFVRNRNNKNEYLILVSTDVSLTKEEIIQTHGETLEHRNFFQDVQVLLETWKGEPCCFI